MLPFKSLLSCLLNNLTPSINQIPLVYPSCIKQHSKKLIHFNPPATFFHKISFPQNVSPVIPTNQPNQDVPATRRTGRMRMKMTPVSRKWSCSEGGRNQRRAALKVRSTRDLWRESLIRPLARTRVA